jgi:ribosome biogenesis GTPase
MTSTADLQIDNIALGWKPFFQQQLTLDDWDTCYMARVSQVHRSQIVTWSERGEQHIEASLCHVDGNIVVGDWLLVDGKTNIPCRILERQTLLARKTAGTAVGEQLIAANIDTVFIVSSCNQDFNVSRIERYLVLITSAGITPVVVLTKADLVEDPEHFADEVKQVMNDIDIVCIDARDPAQLERLSRYCIRGQTVALLGSSGVGKSTLINTLTGEQLPTSQIRSDDDKGRHTTTWRSLHWLNNGGILMDTPGMRELQLLDVEQGLQNVFGDIAQLVQQCRFKNCRHQSEPGCAVKAALENGQLDERRWTNYLKLERETQRNTRSIAEKRASDKATGRLYKSIQSARQKDKNRPQ